MNINHRIPDAPDVVIVGGGIIGLMCALHVLRFFPRARITVFEKGRDIPNSYGSSMRSAACTRQQFGLEHNVAMSIYSTRFYEGFQKLTGEPTEMLWQKGYLFLYHDKPRWEEARAKISQQLQWGLTDVRPLTPADVANEFPYVASQENLVGATFCPTDGYLRPGTILSALRAYLEERNVRFVLSEEVFGFETHGKYVTDVNLDGFCIRCDCVINATGAWARRIGKMLGTDLKVAPVKRYLWTAEYADPAYDMPDADFKKVPMIVCRGSNGVTPYLRPEPGSQPHHFVIGCEHEVAPEPNFSDSDMDRVDPTFKPELGPNFVSIWQTLAGFTPIGERLGFKPKVNPGYYEVTESHNPYVTFDPNYSNVIHACGASGHGVMHAPAIGLIAADLLLHGDYRSFPAAERSLSYQAHYMGTGETEVMKI
jgi:sarcosine oxidase, subunit beta